ncbi:enoyl-CoA hydratase/isomerase family protein [Streptomyces sp. NPDC005708]|uniref:enoyl-CoA hydratase/isomerase family protein n=1 Tax=Streptomyces sp. NPDC005708 TaxID=3154564 RepID=UPI003410E43A
MTQLVEVTRETGVVRIEMNRPEAMNALSRELAEAVVETASEHAADPGVRALVLSAAGRAFCAGADLHETPRLMRQPIDDQVAAHTHMQRLFERFERLPLVKIAEIGGPCVGAGVVLASLCELRVATPQAFFCLPELSFGVPFSLAGLPRLLRAVGPTLAAEMLLTGHRLYADEALARGLVTRVCGADEILGVVDEWTSTITGLSRLLVTNAVSRLREANESLLSSDRYDADSLVLASMDPDSARLSAMYASSITGK